MSTRTVTLNDDAFMVMEEALKRAALLAGVPKIHRPTSYDRNSRSLVIEVQDGAWKVPPPSPSAGRPSGQVIEEAPHAEQKPPTARKRRRS
mgnify:CR=1 FL=1